MSDRVEEFAIESLGVVGKFTCECAPVQAEGTVMGLPFYFRARWDSWQMTIVEQPDDDPVSPKGRFMAWDETYGDDAASASYMDHEVAVSLMEKCARKFLEKHPGSKRQEMSDEKWPHAELAIQWYAAPKGALEWKFYDRELDRWVGWVSKHSPAFDSNHEYEIRPIRKMLVLPQAEVPAPLAERPKVGETYWTIDAYDGGGARPRVWDDQNYDISRFKVGWCWATKDDAEENFKAMTARRAK